MDVSLGKLWELMGQGGLACCESMGLRNPDYDLNDWTDALVNRWA